MEEQKLEDNLKIEKHNKMKFGKLLTLGNKLPLWVRITVDVMLSIILVSSLTIAIMSMIFIRTPVAGVSMKPTINLTAVDVDDVEDTVLINRAKKGSRGDIIVIEKIAEVTEPSKFIIKRLIATGGEKICIYSQEVGLETQYKIKIIEKGKTVAFDYDDPFPENMQQTYVKFKKLKTDSQWTFETINGYEYLVIPDDSVFYMGDNRAHSEDCSKYGPVKRKQIVGKVELIIKKDEKVFNACFNYFWHKIFK